MPVRVGYPGPQSSAVLDALEALLPREVELVRGAEPSACTVLIEGRPTDQMFEANPALQHVVIPFAGVPRATLDAVRQRSGVTLHNLHHNAPETAETALSLMLAAARDVVPMDRALRAHDWRPRYRPSRTLRLEGRAVLVLGYGAIGKRVAATCLAMGMHVTAVRRNPGSERVPGVDFVGVDQLAERLPAAQVLIVALPHTPATDGLLGPQEIALLPQDCIVVNVARALILDEQALFEALRDQKIHGAGLDVWYRYPHADASAVPGYFEAPPAASNTPPSAYPFHELDNVVMSPHRGGTSRDTEGHRVAALAALLACAGRGELLPNRVDLDAGY